MLTLLETIKHKNEILFWFGALMLLGAIITGTLSQITSVQVSGVNAYLKPMKFFFSVWIFAWSMSHYMGYLHNQIQVKIFSWVVVITMGYELLAITFQAARGKLSHFNRETPFDFFIFISMGVMISVVTLWTLWICREFFVQKTFAAPATLIWGIRLGIILTVLFALEGGVIAAMLKHTIGGPDTGEGLSVLNWSKKHGDLRVAHFFGIHALQVVPLLAAVAAKNTQQVIIVASLYFLFVTFTFIQALLGKPFIHF
ncbi:MAG: hypothetical protein MUC87_04215 [Bacteroidia bacterium]|jgi:hypothetical protein|nr:hypothetical protein [Bacteroidia bacterium]